MGEDSATVCAVLQAPGAFGGFCCGFSFPLLVVNPGCGATLLAIQGDLERVMLAERVCERESV